MLYFPQHGGERLSRDTFLSIDLDYWSDYYEDVGMMSLLYRVLALDVPIHCVTYHHDMLPLVNSTKGINRLVNMDYHSDLGDLTPSDLIPHNLNEGTWINYVEFANRGTYQWIYPDDNCYECSGRCDVDVNPFTVRKRKSERICWDNVKHKCGGSDPLKLVGLNRIAAVGISISPDWNTTENTRDALLILSDRNLITPRNRNAIQRLLHKPSHHYMYEKNKKRVSKAVYKTLTHV